MAARGAAAPRARRASARRATEFGIAMETPLAPGSPASDARHLAAVGTVRLPNELQDRVKSLLLPRMPMCPANISHQHRARLMASMSGVWYLCGAFVASRAVTNAGAREAGIVMVVACVMCSLSSGAAVLQLFQKVVPHAVVQLEAPVEPAVGAALTRSAKRAEALRAGFCTTIVPCGVLVYEMVPDTWYEWMIGAMFLLCWFPTITGVYLSFAGPSLACLLEAGKVDGLRSEIIRATASTADYRAFATGVFAAHNVIAKLSAGVQPQILAFGAELLTLTILWMFMGFGPRPDYGPDFYGFGSWYNLFLSEPYCLGMATTFAIMLVYTLMAPAKVTSACQRVGDAVNDLRVTPRTDGTAELATAHELHRIEGLKRYINELNRDQG